MVFIIIFCFINFGSILFGWIFVLWYLFDKSIIIFLDCFWLNNFSAVFNFFFIFVELFVYFIVFRVCNNLFLLDVKFDLIFIELLKFINLILLLSLFIFCINFFVVFIL